MGRASFLFSLSAVDLSQGFEPRLTVHDAANHPVFGEDKGPRDGLFYINRQEGTVYFNHNLRFGFYGIV
jgi:hypothetical protein